MFACDSCGDVFTENHNLTRHIISVHNKLKHNCVQCDFVSNRKDSLARHIKSKHSAKRSADVLEMNSEPKNKKRRTDDWDEGDLSFTDIDNLIHLVEAENWNGEELSSTDLDNLIPMVEAEKEKSQVGGDLWGENDVEPEPEKQAFKCPHCSMSLSTRGSLHNHIKVKHSHDHGYICDQCGQRFPLKDYLIKHLKRHEKMNAKKPPTKVKTRINVEEDLRVESDKSSTSESAFRGMVNIRTWRIRGASDPLSLMAKYHNTLKRTLRDLLIKNAVKMYITVDITMVRKTKEGVTERTTAYFQGSTRTLLRESQIPEMLRSSTEKIGQSFDEFLRNGSGWILESIDYLRLFSAEYAPMNGKGHIPTPKAIVDKKAIINPQNENDNCVMYCIAASQHYGEIDQNNPHLPAQYEPFFVRYNFEGCSMPMEIDDFTKFEKNNNMAINVYHIKHDGNLISPLRITQREVKLEDYVNLLLIEGEEHSHYAWIRNFDRLLSYGDDNPRKFCPFCCNGFDVRYSKTLEEHLPLCRKYGGQKAIIPPKGKNIVEFTDHHKCLEHPVAIYADFEAINQKVDSLESDLQNSKTIIKTKHICSGYSYTVVSPYLENRVVTHRGEDAGKHFLESIMTEEIRISKWLKENEKKEHNLSVDEEKQWQAETKCYMCNDKFYKGCKPPLPKNKHLNTHLKKIKELLVANKLDVKKIPSLKLVKKQKRIISFQLHPDKQGDVSSEERFAKQEELKKFNVDNENLQNYLIENELLEDEEQDEEFEAEDDLTDEEIERIKKKGWKVRDHDHWTGEYRGAAHSGCNIALRKTRKIPVMFHNLSGKFHFLYKAYFYILLLLLQDMMDTLLCKASLKLRSVKIQ